MSGSVRWDEATAAQRPLTELCSKVVTRGRIRKISRPISFSPASAALLLRGRLKFHDVVLVAGIRLLLLFHDLLKLKSFDGEFIRQALKQRALFYVRRQLTHMGKFSRFGA